MSLAATITEHDFAHALPSSMSCTAWSTWSIQHPLPSSELIVPITQPTKPTYTLSTKPQKRNGILSPKATLTSGDAGAAHRIIALTLAHDNSSATLHFSGHSVLSSPLTIARQHRPLSPLPVYNFKWKERTLQWRSMGPSQTVLELVETVRGQRIALFVYTSDKAQMVDPATGKNRWPRKGEVGEVHFLVNGEFMGKEGMEEGCIMAVAAVVRLRR